MHIVAKCVAKLEVGNEPMGFLRFHGFFQGKSGKNQRFRKSQGILKHQGAKVNKDAEKNF